MVQVEEDIEHAETGEIKSDRKGQVREKREQKCDSEKEVCKFNYVEISHREEKPHAAHRKRAQKAWRKIKHEEISAHQHDHKDAKIALSAAIRKVAILKVAIYRHCEQKDSAKDNAQMKAADRDDMRYAPVRHASAQRF